jgi:hypothetical protein
VSQARQFLLAVAGLTGIVLPSAKSRAMWLTLPAVFLPELAKPNLIALLALQRPGPEQ